MHKSERPAVTARKTFFFGPRQAHATKAEDKAAVELVCAALVLAVFVLACRIFSLL
jgi:hypothetical protein